MKGKYNIMCFKNTLIGSFDYDNIYKVSMLLSLSGLKLITGVCGGVGGTHPGMIYPLYSRYTMSGCVWGEGVHTLVNCFGPQRYSERKGL
jgi:hypothetical protein